MDITDRETESEYQGQKWPPNDEAFTDIFFFFKLGHCMLLTHGGVKYKTQPGRKILWAF